MSILQYICLPVFLLLSSKLAQVVGGAVYIGLVFPLKFPVIGSVVRFFLIKPIKLLGVVKLISWMISSFGLLFGYWLYSFIWGSPHRPIEFWLILVVAVYLVAEIVQYLVTFDLIDFDKATKIINVISPETVKMAGNIPKVRTCVALHVNRR